MMEETMTETYKMRHTLLHSTGTMGHQVKLIGRGCRTDTKKYFTQHVISLWNALPQGVGLPKTKD